MGQSPYAPEGIALARRTLVDSTYMTSVTPEARAELVQMAFDILHKDRAARLNLTPQKVEAKIVTVPLALWQAGPRARRLTGKPKLLLLTNRTPGDAA
jgi:hypothetical protein